MQDIINGRCGWCGTDELYVKYHDEEWLVVLYFLYLASDGSTDFHDLFT